MIEAAGASQGPLWGISAAFASPEPALAAARALREARLGRVELYSPIPLPGAAAALQLVPQPIGPFALAAGVAGGVAMMGLCLYATASSYVFDIGGRPRFSWPAFIVPSFSFAMLAAAVAVVLAMLMQSRLPRLNHPAFNIEGFTRASRDRYFVVVEAGHDDGFDPVLVERAMATLPARPLHVGRVPR